MDKEDTMTGEERGRESVMFKHTPGPWLTSTERPFSGAVIAKVQPDERGRDVAVIARVPHTDGAVNGENRANIVLLAAAPELLAALKELVGHATDGVCMLDESWNVVKDARAAIALAERELG